MGGDGGEGHGAIIICLDLHRLSSLSLANGNPLRHIYTKLFWKFTEKWSNITLHWKTSILTHKNILLKEWITKWRRECCNTTQFTSEPPAGKPRPDPGFLVVLVFLLLRCLPDTAKVNFTFTDWLPHKFAQFTVQRACWHVGPNFTKYDIQLIILILNYDFSSLKKSLWKRWIRN